MRHIISTEDVQHPSVTTSAWKMHTRVFGTDLSYHQYSGGCAVEISRIISTGEDVGYRTTKTVERVVGSYIYLGE